MNNLMRVRAWPCVGWEPERDENGCIIKNVIVYYRIGLSGETLLYKKLVGSDATPEAVTTCYKELSMKFSDCMCAGLTDMEISILKKGDSV